MSWIIRDITLPQDPQSLSKKTARIQKPAVAAGEHPDPTVNQPARFDLTIKGLIWPRAAAQALDEATKNADTESLPLLVEDEETSGVPWISGFYAVSRSNVERKKPLYTKDETTSLDEEVYSYTITFTKFADAGSDEPAEEGGPEEDEIGTGFLDMDSDDDGDIDLDGIFEFMTSIFTWGASDPV